jgi:hypothetical protein
MLPITPLKMSSIVSDENKNIASKTIIFPTNWKRHLNTGTLSHSHTHTYGISGNPNT